MKFDAVVIGGGWSGLQAALDFQAQGKECALFTFGRSLERIDYSAFRAAGGYLLYGDKVLSGTIADGKVTGIVSSNLGDVQADCYVLATGKFFGGGLVADMDTVSEPIFGLDVEYDRDRAGWFDADFFKPQRFMDFGLRTDAEGHPFKDGRAVENLVATGEILAK